MAEPHYEDDLVTLYAGDCLDVMRGLATASVDAVVTDPPYGLEFMGREWDGADGFRRSLNPADAGRDNAFGRMSRTSPEYRTGSRDAVIHDPATERGGFQDGAGGNPYSRSRIEYGRGGDSSPLFQEWCEAWASEALRVLKPGGHLLAFGGTRTWHRLACAIEDAGFEVRDSIAWLYGSGFPKSRNLDGEWEGWGTALKPAFEPVVMARKALAGTVAANMAEHRTGALNIDACRVPAQGEDTRRNAAGGENGLNGEGTFRIRERRADEMPERDGRWPANVALDESQAAALDKQTGTLTSGKAGADGHVRNQPTREQGIYGGGKGLWTEGGPAGELYGDSGGASRFFYCAKAGTGERPRDGETAHPTVKPVDLMRWLVRLVTPPGGTVLEPFAGSGTTAEACVIEGFRCIAIEREATYLPLIVARLSKPIQPDLFGGAA